MRVLIVDDEPPARARLRRLLAAHPHITVVGEAGDGEQALAAVAALSPDVLLLDVQMPGGSGLDVAASLPDPAPRVVFVTAFDQYALPAFEAAALDYLLKPVDPARLAHSMARWPQQSGTGHAEVSTGAGAEDSKAPSRRSPQPPPERLLIAERGRTLVVEVVGIVRLEAADNYVQLHTQGQGQPLIRRTLASLLGDLGPRFVRIHRRHAVALSHVRQITPRERGDATLALHNGTELPVARPWREALVERLRHASSCGSS